MLNISREIFTAWDENKVMYCHWKSNEHLMAGLNGETDIDVLVSPKDKNKCEQLLLKLNLVKFLPQIGSRYDDVDEWIGYDPEQGKLIHLHLHYRLLTGRKYLKEYTLPWSELAFSLRIKEDASGIYIMCPELEIIILYTRIVLKGTLKNAVYSDDYLREITYLKEHIDTKLLNKLCCELFSNKGKIIYENIMNDALSPQILRRIKKVVLKNLSEHTQHNRFTTLLLSKLYRIFILTQKFFKRYINILFITQKTAEGKAICFIGADGAGKSTITSDIEKWLSWKIDCKKFYLGSGDHYNSFLKSCLKLFGNAAKTRNSKKQNENSGIKPENTVRESRVTFVGLLIDVIRAFEHVNCAKYKLKTLKKAHRYINNGGIAIFDRYPQVDYIGIYDGPKIAHYCKAHMANKLISYLSRKENELIKECIEYKVDLLVRLILPPEISIQRKPEEDFENVSYKANITKSVRINTENDITIDATQSYSAEMTEVKDAIWQTIIPS